MRDEKGGGAELPLQHYLYLRIVIFGYRVEEGQIKIIAIFYEGLFGDITLQEMC